MKLEVKIPKATVGFIVGRFQVHEPHAGHIELINTVYSNHARTVIILGVSPIPSSISDPLPWQSRRAMLFETFPSDKYPNLSVAYILDQPSNSLWSKKLDVIVSEHLGPRDTALIYGSRDSFIASYSGKYPTLELQPKTVISATEIRDKISLAPISDPLFRAGVIFAAYNRYDSVHPTVDVFLYNPSKRVFWLGRKGNDPVGKYRLAGGFVDPKDESMEAAAKREVYEELTIGVNNLYFVGTQRVNDWRYANNPHEKIMTTLFVGTYSNGCVRADDDLAEARQFSIDDFDPKTMVVEHHIELVEKAINFCKKTFVDDRIGGVAKE